MTASLRAPAAHIFRVPAILGAVTAFALVLALIEDGIWDGAAAIALGAPLAIAAWKIAKARAKAPPPAGSLARRGDIDDAE
jgi:hypothetical protein